MPARPTAPSTVPVTSNGRPAADGSELSGTFRRATTTTSAASGRLIRNTRRHDHTSISQPPRNGPIAAAIPPRPDQAPMARARSGAENEAERMARLLGVSSAPPMPCSALAATRTPIEGANPHSAEARANHTVPTTNIRRRPSRSDSDPPSRMRAARVRVYPFRVHCRPPRSESRSWPIRPSATLTTVASSMAIPEPRTVARITQRPAGSPNLACP